MPYNRDNKNDKPFKKNYSKPDTDRKKRYDSNSETPSERYNPNDKDELAPPRFLAPPPSKSYNRDGAGSGPKRPYERKDTGGFGDKPKRPYEKRDNADFGDRPKKTYERKDAGSFGDKPKRPYEKRDGAGYNDRPKNPYERKTSSNFGDKPKRPYEKRDNASFGDASKRPYEKRDNAGFNDRAKRPYEKRDGAGFGDGSKKPYEKRDNAGFNDRAKRPYEKRDGAGFGDGGKRPYEKRDSAGFNDRPKKPYEKRDGAGFDRPVRSYEKRDSNDFNDRPARPYEKRETGSPFDKKDGTKKPFRPSYDPEIKVKKSYADAPKKTFSERKKELTGDTHAKEDIRLNKYVANSGVCSRREADELISKGTVTVNGKVITEMGYRVKLTDTVCYEGKKILPEPFVYILMNKPKDFLTTTEDDKGRKTVMDLVADKIEQRIFPVGRLDRNTTGVLLLTNDGEVTQALTHPSFEIKKIYQVELDKKATSADLDKLVSGIELEDGEAHADGVAFVESEDKRHIGIEIHSGRNRIVRRMFEHLGFEVEKLDRVSFGIFTKKDLPRGKWRHLTQGEVGFLMKLKSKM
jgi:23S rRNA pseudouridine2605 synthase